MTDESAIAVGVPAFQRPEALDRFLASVPAGVSRVIIADNGPPGAHADIYAAEWPVEIDVLDLGHDVGIGACRDAISQVATEDYLWMGDCDMEFTRADDLRILQAILDAHDDLGGVSGWLVEGDVVRSGARDLHQVGEWVIKDGTDPAVELEPYPHARFDFIPQAGLFKAAVFESYGYDADLTTHEHMDFFWGHKARETGWNWASTPMVQIRHNRWIDSEYRQSRGQHNTDYEYLQAKWGITGTVPGRNSDWAQHRDRTWKEQAFGAFRALTPPRVWVPVRQTALKLGIDS